MSGVWCSCSVVRQAASQAPTFENMGVVKDWRAVSRDASSASSAAEEEARHHSQEWQSGLGGNGLLY